MCIHSTTVDEEDCKFGQLVYCIPAHSKWVWRRDYGQTWGQGIEHCTLFPLVVVLEGAVYSQLLWSVPAGFPLDLIMVMLRQGIVRG